MSQSVTCKHRLAQAFQEELVNQFVAMPLVVLGVGILLQLIFSRLLSQKWKGWLAFLTGILALAGTLTLLPSIMRGTALDKTFFVWDKNIPFQYHIDGLSMIFALMATGIGSAI